MFNIKEVFIDDLYKWIMVKEAEIKPNGIGMLNIYENNYLANTQVHILVPLKKPVKSARNIMKSSARQCYVRPK